VSVDNTILRMRRGQAAAAARQQELRRAEGPRPAQAVAEALSAAIAVAAIGRWPGPRDPASEAAVLEVRRRWARIERRARRRVAELAGLAEAPELVTQFEAWLLRRPAASPRKRRVATTKPRAAVSAPKPRTKAKTPRRRP
jgi:hypothetical protein